MKVNLDENGYVREWALVGDNGGIDVPEPEDLQGFMSCFEGYRLVDGKLLKDTAKDEEAQLEHKKAQLRQRRKIECYAYINRGQLWYGLLSVKQLAELAAWYNAWRNVTETLIVPERPTWLEDDS